MSKYSNSEDILGIRKYIRLHIQQLDKVLTSLEHARYTISSKKLQQCMNRICIVGYICGAEGRLPATTKVIKILEWPACATTAEACAFIGVCVYYYIQIRDFAIITALIYLLFRKGLVFLQIYKCQEAIDTLKIMLTTAPVLIRIVYEEGASLIIYVVDASSKGQGCVLI